MLRKYTAVALLALLFTAGCQSNLTAKRVQAKNPLAKNSVKTPSKFVDVWNTYVQSTPEGKVMRGVAGRVHFYADSAKKQAVKVDGDVTVFVFDGEETDPARSKPLRVYQFKAEALPKHYAHKKPLGHGYDFFLPFDEAGGEEKRLVVMTRFDDRLEGSFVLSQPVNTILQGTKRPTTTPENSIQEFLASNTVLGEANRKMAEETIPAELNPIRQVGYEKSAEKPVDDISRRSVATISLSDGMARRLAEQQPEITPTPSTPNPSTPPAPASPPEMKATSEKPSPHRTEKLDYPKIEFPEPPF